MNMDDSNYKFFQHITCEYFPCHRVEALEDFNCLFCYCPLYALGKNCGGQFSYTDKGVKNCSKCDFPHHRDHYEAVLERLARLIEQVKLTKI